MTSAQTPSRPTLPPVPRTAIRRDEQRALTLELESLLEDRLATRTQSFRCGTALFNEDFPRAGALNVLRVESGVPALDPGALMEFVDELQAGLPQRSIRVIDDERAAQLRPGFAAAGWVAGQVALLAPRRLPDRPVDVSAIREVPLEQLFEARQATLRRAHRDLDSAEQLAVANVLPAGDVELRAFAATVGTEVAAYAVARVHGDVAKLTELDAFARSQGQGLGRAVIWGAVTRLREAGARTVAVEAEDDNWSQWTFRRLGFEEIGHTHRFVRPWGDAAPPPAI
ncbi:MAG TPA: GNAT family N-acetyltransferase [Thermoleophilaceae bacterium]|jgi:predicted N-acetyltransferase YhbS